MGIVKKTGEDGFAMCRAGKFFHRPDQAIKEVDILFQVSDSIVNVFYDAIPN